MHRVIFLAVFSCTPAEPCSVKQNGGGATITCPDGTSATIGAKSGSQDEQGLQGEVGPPGPEGPQGVPGITGSPGLTGLDGASCTIITTSPNPHSAVLACPDGTAVLVEEADGCPPYSIPSTRVADQCDCIAGFEQDITMPHFECKPNFCMANGLYSNGICGDVNDCGPVNDQDCF